MHHVSSVFRLYGGSSRFPKMEDMPHFHYDFVDLGREVKVKAVFNFPI